MMSNVSMNRNRVKTIRNRMPLSRSLYVVFLILFVIGCTQFEPLRVNKVETGSISNINRTSVTVGGNVLEKGDNGIEQHGFCISPQPDPTIENGMRVDLGPKNNTGLFSADVSGLDPGATLYVKAYAQNSEDVVYGQAKEFTTLSVASPMVNTAAVSNVKETSATGGALFPKVSNAHSVASNCPPQ